MKTLALLALCCALSVSLFAGEKEPPGPPWTRDFMKAQAEALNTGKPIFMYFTKTYCPNCVPVERDLLPNEKLKPVYGDVAWVYVYNDFEGGPADLASDRVRKRFSVTSWPQLLIADPVTLEVIGETGRSVESFLPAIQSAKSAVKLAPEAARKEARAKLEKADTLATKLQGKPSKAELSEALKAQDIVVLSIAAEYAAKNDPAALVEDALKLLDNPSDQVRGAVCEAIAREREASANGKESGREREASASGRESAREREAQASELRKKLESLAKDPKESRNPNVLRMNVVKALARVGNAASLAAIREFAEKGGVNNGLTGATVEAIGEIGKRDKEAKATATQILLASFPAAKDADWPNPKQYEQMATGIAKKVHKALTDLTAAKVDFPGTYDEATRTKLIEAFESAKR